MVKHFLYLHLLLLLGHFVNAQTINGIISNSQGDPLVSATIQVSDVYAITDFDGRYSISLLSLDGNAIVSYIGYEKLVIPLNDLFEQPNIILNEGDAILETMTISTSRYQKRLSETTVSVEVLKPELISSVNTVDIDDAIDKVSGVQMINGQANIRGGSGFSYGAGSRVMLLIDDIPALQVDAGFTNWGDIPVENIGQVEVVKGAASSLYGSSALNGIINIRTGEAGSKPVTKISAGYSQYMSPRDKSKKWWGDTTRYESNFSILHKRKLGQLDLVGSLFYTRLESYNQFTFKNRKRATLKMKFHLSDRLKLTINTLFNKGNNGDFFLWRNGKEAAYQPFSGTASEQNNFRMYLDPSLNYYDSKNNHHRFQLRYHHIDNNNSGNQSNQSNTYFGEYQFSRKFLSAGLELTSGVVGTITDTRAELFGDTTFTTQTLAVYTQIDKKINDHFSISGGIRYEYNKQITPEEFNDIVVPGGVITDGRPVTRLGARYAFNDFSSLRTSWGQGYRFPTVTERFISTVFGGFVISPNPDLLPEKGWTAELAYKQGVKLGASTGYVDIALFGSQYEDMMEFLFVPETFSFTSTNVGSTQIYGSEISLFGKVNLGPDTEIQLFGGYTYLDPRYKNFENNEAVKANLSTSQNVLKYRNAHSFKMDAQLNYNRYSFGGAVNFASHMVNVDRVLEQLDLFDPPLDLLGLKAYRDENNRGFTRFDIRASVDFEFIKCSVLIHNLLNEEYIVRPALLEAPRTLSARVDITI